MSVGANGAFSRGGAGCQPLAIALSRASLISLVLTNPASHKFMKIMQKRNFLIAFLILIIWGHSMGIAEDLNTLPVTAPIDTDSAGRAGDIATHSVVRLICPAANTVGTGFLHKSGNILTADHVTRGCPQLK
jgi:hypothetical protein